MSEHIKKYYSCDRCKADLGEERPKQNMHVTCHKDGEWAMEISVDWLDLCDRCKLAIEEFFK